MNPCIFIQMISAWVFSSWAEANGGNIWPGPVAKDLAFVWESQSMGATKNHQRPIETLSLCTLEGSRRPRHPLEILGWGRMETNAWAASEMSRNASCRSN